MKYSIRKKIIKYRNSKNTLLEILVDCDRRKEVTNKDKEYISGLFNETWQKWNQLYRSLWLTYYYGGETLISHVGSNVLGIITYSFTDTESEAIMRIIREKKQVRHYREPTWGSKSHLELVSSYYSSLSRPNIVSSSLSIYGDYIDDFQIIRNNMIHLTQAGVLELKSSLISRNYNSPVSYYPHNHPVNYLFHKIGLNSELAYETIFYNLDQMIETIFLVNSDI